MNLTLSRNNKIALGCMAALFLSFPSFLQAQGNSSDLKASAYRVSIAQDEVSREADEVRAAIVLVLQDFYQNQLASKNADEAKAVALQVAKLNDQEIKPLVELLRQIGTAQKQQVSGELVNVSKTQKRVQVSIKQLENRLMLQVGKASVLSRFQDLALRQLETLRQTKMITDSGLKAKKLPTRLSGLLAISQGQQDALRDEITLAMGTLQRVAEKLPEAERPLYAEAFKLATEKRVKELGIEASKQLEGNYFSKANVSQQRLYDGLMAVVMKLKEPEDAADRLQAMQEKLNELAEKEKQLAESSKSAQDESEKEAI